MDDIIPKVENISLQEASDENFDSDSCDDKSFHSVNEDYDNERLFPYSVDSDNKESTSFEDSQKTEKCLSDEPKDEFDIDEEYLKSLEENITDDLKQEDKKGALADCNKAIEYQSDYVKAFIRRAKLNEELQNLDDALKDYQRILDLDPSNCEARWAVTVLPQKIDERNEKLKQEMMGKLKDLGNIVLRPFGLSTDNFEVNQDPQSGGYNINFKQNK